MAHRGGRRALLHTGNRNDDGRPSRQDGHRALQQSLRAQQRQADESFDLKAGYARFSEGPARVGYLFNMTGTTLVGEDRLERSALDMYFLQQDGTTFKATVAHEPFFYVALALTDDGSGQMLASEREVQTCLERKFDGILSGVTVVELEDLEMPNHLAGSGKRRFLKLSFRSVSELMTTRKAVQAIVDRNQKRQAAGESLMADAAANGDPLCLMVDMREYDVPYVTRASIDCKVRVGLWYTVTPLGTAADIGTKGCVKVESLGESFAGVPEPRILAWDIECTKAPLKFPDARSDHVYMISYMLDGRGFLIINREVVTEDVDDFEYTPHKEYPGPFQVTNCANERAVMEVFIAHIKETRPNIFVTFNGDFFDWPFVAQRCRQYNIDLPAEVGIGPVSANGRTVTDDGVGASDVEWRGRTAVHIDCLYWVKRDSFLPQGSHGLKAVTREKLGYDPVEIDPEDMLAMARDNPRHMASYSVSDAVATYYLYLKYIHAFVFSLSTIIPMPPDDVLRKGSGTLCESLLQVEAEAGGIVAPNKQTEALDQRYEGHLLDSETYLGGHVECLESGVFRSDIPCSWKLVPSAFDGLIAKIDNALTFAIEVEYGMQRTEVANYDEVRSAIVERLEALRDMPTRQENPVIYHLDVAAMYPNIILSNRLQPQAMVTEATCQACDYNTDPSNRCQRRMPWRWRGEYFPPDESEVSEMRRQLMGELVDGVPFEQLPLAAQQTALKARLKTYSQTVYKRVKDTVEEDRDAIVCQRENPFYVNTVRKFRDRRYDYKIATKKANKALAEAHKSGSRLDVEAAAAKVTLYDSLQLAHKCILNSFYGYVMRKGARWHSMEMAGVVTFTGSNLIQQARQLVEQVGRPLELDTDGIWCVLPASFPQKFKFKTVSGGSIDIIYPCVMLNADVHERYTNHQYQQLVEGSRNTYSIRSECSIFFELDGPYAAMVLPASPEEGRLLKKRYAVFEDDGTLAELKGFELKRRGELQMIKVFQQQAFGRFLEGDSLAGCYGAVAEVANYWLDVLDTQGEDLSDEEIIDLLSENRSMTQKLEDYGEQKSMAISTAKRLAEFLGAEMVKDKGLACKLLVAKKPAGEPVTERAIPAAIFHADLSKRRFFLRKWLKDSSMTTFDIRTILDWDYYRTRIAGAIQKIITIPAALQRVPNPVPRVAHPDWLARQVAADNSTVKQVKLDAFLTRGKPKALVDATAVDIEDGTTGTADKTAPRAGTNAGPKAKLGRITMHMVAREDAPQQLEDKARTAEQQASETAASAVAEAIAAPAPPLSPSMSPDELQAWLASRKAYWRGLRKAKKEQAARDAAAGVQAKGKGKRLAIAASSQAKGLKVSTAVAAPAARHEPVAVQHGVGYLQVVEMRPVHDRPGTFTVFAFTGPKRLQSFRLTVERTLYVSKANPVDPASQAAAMMSSAQDMRLPHDAPVLHLYQVKLSEGRFQGALHQVRRCFDVPDILAVYESRTPLLFKALASAAHVMRLSDVARARFTGMEHGARPPSQLKGDKLAFAGAGPGKGAAKPGAKAAQPAKPKPKQTQLTLAGLSGASSSAGVSSSSAPVEVLDDADSDGDGNGELHGAGVMVVGPEGELQLVPEDGGEQEGAAAKAGGTGARGSPAADRSSSKPIATDAAQALLSPSGPAPGCPFPFG